MPEAPRDSSAERTMTETLCTPPRLVSAACRDACLVHIYPSGPSMGKRYSLSITTPMVISVTVGRWILEMNAASTAAMIVMSSVSQSGASRM